MSRFETSGETVDELQSVVEALIEQGRRVDQSDYACALFRLAKTQLENDYRDLIAPAYVANKRMKWRQQLEELAKKAGIHWV